MNKIIIFAPGVTSKGGVTLLQSLIFDRSSKKKIILFLDSSIQEFFPNNELHIVDNSYYSKYLSQFKLKIYDKDDTIICFHSLPLSINVKAKVIVFFKTMKSLKN